jgi:Cu+-exporting ATPase
MAEAPNTSLQPAKQLGELSREEAGLVAALARQSTHPYSMRIVQHLTVRNLPGSIENVKETPGAGLAGTVNGHAIAIGSFAWLKELGVALDQPPEITGGLTALAIDGVHRGTFVLASRVREEADRLILELGHRYEVALLSGDNARERELFQTWFGGEARLHFNQSPQEKLQFIKSLQSQGRVVMMVGDGLNDAGALRQSDVGVAVVERTGAFSPASDVIMEAGAVGQLGRLLAFSKKSVRIIHLSFAVSALYNLIGISIAAMGVLSPLIAAILMPLSSVSVVLFACGMTTWAAKSLKLYRV